MVYSDSIHVSFLAGQLRPEFTTQNDVKYKAPEAMENKPQSFNPKPYPLYAVPYTRALNPKLRPETSRFRSLKPTPGRLGFRTASGSHLMAPVSGGLGFRKLGLRLLATGLAFRV